MSKPNNTHNGHLPCCHRCAWSCDFDIETFSVQCLRHKLMIRYALSTFCADFESFEHPGNVVDQGHVERGMVYDWVEVSLKDPASPSLPKLHREYVSLAPVNEYLEWTEDEERKLRLNLIDQVSQKVGLEAPAQ